MELVLVVVCGKSSKKLSKYSLVTLNSRSQRSLETNSQQIYGKILLGYGLNYT